MSLKNAIAPIQAWLLSQGRCVGCSMPLSGAKKRKGKKEDVFVCKCKRVYVKNNKTGKYRRALLTEV